MMTGKKLNDIFSIGMCLVFFGVMYWFYSCNQKRMWFEEQSLGVSLEQFKAKWGEPQRQIIDEGERIVFYDCNNLLGHQYVFKFDSEKHNLTFKYYDD